MITQQQKQQIIELFKQGISQTEIAIRTHVSRTKVSEILKESRNNLVNNKESKQEQSIETDPEIQNLKKEARKQELNKKIRELKEPFKTEKEIKELIRLIGILNSKIKFLEERADKNLADNLYEWKCSDCGAKGRVSIHLKCTNCQEEQWWGWVYP